MNQPKRGLYAKLYRKQFVPAPGHLLVAADFKAIQAIIIGYLAEDNDFIKAAKLGVHAILASHVLCRQGIWPAPINLQANEFEIATKIAELKLNFKKAYDDAKTCTYSSSFGGTPFKMHMEFPENFPKLKDAKDLQDLYFSTIGRGIRAWHTKILDEAQRKCYLESSFGQRHYFWNVFTYNTKSRKMEWGPDAKKALAFLPQAIERIVMTEAVKRLFKKGLGKYLRWIIHDGLEPCEIPIDLAPEIIPQIREELERPVPELDGLSFPVEIEVSNKSWGDMKLWTP